MKRCRNDGGVALLEFAIVVPLLLLLAFGTAEMGLAWNAASQVEAATSTAARVAATMGAEANADVNTLDALRAALPEEALENLEQVVIFEPISDDGDMPGGCTLGTGTGHCNLYTGELVRTFDPGNPEPLGTFDDRWPATTRDDTLDGDPPDYIGVWVRTRHDDTTGTFWQGMTITRASIYRIQPDIDG
jgi:TadE-like protein